MSVDTFPFATSEDMAQFEEADAGNRKKLMIAGAALAAVALGAGYLLMSGGSSSSDEEFIPRAPRAAKAVAAPQTAAQAPAKKLPTAYQDQIGRDPFKPQYVVPVAAPAAAAPASTTTTTSAPATTTTATGDTASTSATQAAPATVTTRYPLKLVSISQTNDEARFTSWSVDGQKTTVLPGQRFGKHGELVVLAFSKNAQGAVDKAILQVGDDSPMEVAVGQTNSVL